MIAYDEIDVAESPVSLDGDVYDPLGFFLTALIVVEAASIRFTYDGITEPTSSVGVLLNIGDTVRLTTLEQIRNFKAAAAGVSPLEVGSLKIHYENNDYGFKERDGDLWQT